MLQSGFVLNAVSHESSVVRVSMGTTWVHPENAALGAAVVHPVPPMSTNLAEQILAKQHRVPSLLDVPATKF